jgi:hypothetical protein
MPSAFALVMGGTLGDQIGFFGRPIRIRGDELEEPGDLFLVFAEPLGAILPEGLLSIRIGRFTPAADPYDDVALVSARVTAAGFRLRDRQGGVELYGRPGGRVLWHLGLVNGESPVEEPTDGKDVYGGAEVKIGGMPYLVTDGPANPAKPWRDDSITIGVAGYTGRHLIVPVDPAADPFRNRFYRVIGKARGKIADLDVRSAISLGRDLNPDGTGDDVDSLMWSVAADYVVFPWFQLRARYDEVWIGDADTVRTISPNVRAFLRMNVYVQAETTFALRSGAERPTLQLELFFAF